MPTLANIDGRSLVGDTSGIARGLADLGQAYASKRRDDKREGDLVKRDEAIDEYSQEVIDGSADAFISLSKVAPQYAQYLQGMAQSNDKAAAQQEIAANKRIGSFSASARGLPPVQQSNMYKVRAQEALTNGDEGQAREYLKMSQLAISNFEQFEAEQNEDISTSGMGAAALAVFDVPEKETKEVNKRLLERQSDGTWTDVTPDGGEGGDDEYAGLPAEAVAFRDLIKDFTPEQQKTAKLVKAGLKGRAMSNAELSAIESGDIKDYADWKAKMKQQQKFAELTGSSRAKAIDKGFDSIVKIDAGVRNIDRAIAAIDSGAGVGAVEKLWPSIRSASVELDNIRGQMALDVVGATTFGALSKGELDLAKDIALPTGLNTEELRDYLARKKEAQTKLRAYYNEQVQFLDQGGTVAGFLRKKEAEQGGGDEASASQYPEGATATNAQGQTITYRGGQWLTM